MPASLKDSIEDLIHEFFIEYEWGNITQAQYEISTEKLFKILEVL
jgi:hypothetical protein